MNKAELAGYCFSLVNYGHSHTSEHLVPSMSLAATTARNDKAGKRKEMAGGLETPHGLYTHLRRNCYELIFSMSLRVSL